MDTLNTNHGQIQSGCCGHIGLPGVSCHPSIRLVSGQEIILKKEDKSIPVFCNVVASDEQASLERWLLLDSW